MRASAGGESITSKTLADESGFAHRFEVLTETAESVILADDPELVARFDELMEQLTPRLGIGDQAAMFHSA
jgi:hypothetical protein